jgi:AcrR family transcriptional regulator
MATPHRRLGRRPGTTSSRAAILAAARELFADLGFERATIRAIATRADVDPATVYHFFATKEDLLDAALQLPMDPRLLLDAIAANPGREGETLVRQALRIWDEPATRLQFRALLRIGVSHERAGEALKNLFSRQLVEVLAQHMPRKDAELRAGLVATQMAGLALLRFIIPLDAVARAESQTIVDLVGPNIQRYFDGS